jgi:hypothetical protein
MTVPPDTFVPPTNEEHRRHRTYQALFHLGDRHGATTEARARAAGGVMVTPYEAVRLVELLAAGSSTYEADEPAIDGDDVMAALTLMPLVRAELDETELGLLIMARGRGMTWEQIAYGLGLGSAQAAKQRHDRLARRVQEDP